MKLIEALDQKMPRRNPFIQKRAQHRMRVCAFFMHFSGFEPLRVLLPNRVHARAVAVALQNHLVK